MLDSTQCVKWAKREIVSRQLSVSFRFVDMNSLRDQDSLFVIGNISGYLIYIYSIVIIVINTDIY